MLSSINIVAELSLAINKYMASIYFMDLCEEDKIHVSSWRNPVSLNFCHHISIDGNNADLGWGKFLKRGKIFAGFFFVIFFFLLWIFFSFCEFFCSSFSPVEIQMLESGRCMDNYLIFKMDTIPGISHLTGSFNTTTLETLFHFLMYCRGKTSLTVMLSL